MLLPLLKILLVSTAFLASASVFAASDKNQLNKIGERFWNVRGTFKMYLVVDIQTQMSIIQLSSGKFLIIDTIEMDQKLRAEMDKLTNNGEKIEAVIAAHPFHTLFFPSFYQAYPNASYYGTPRHLRKITNIPWKGNLNDCVIRKKWEPEVKMRIPAGAEFIDPQPESTNHFISVFVYHPTSRTLHVDDTIMYTEDPGFILRLIGYKKGTFSFHPSMDSDGLHPTPQAPYLFRDWMKNMLNDWNFDNICTAHIGVKIGGAHKDVETLLEKAEPVFAKINEENKKKNPDGILPPGMHPNTNVKDDKCV